jgi:hypothetical protein
MIPRTCFEMVMVLVFVLTALAGGRAMATDQTLPGNRLLVVDLPGNGQLLHVAKRENLNVHIPTPDGPDDPIRAGGSFVIYNPTTCESATFDMPASGWHHSHAEGTIAFKFVNRAAPAPPSEVQIAEIGVDRVKVRARAAGITLNESSQGSLGVVVTLGSLRYCTLFGGSIRTDQPGMFAARLAPAPSACPPASCVP